MIEPTATLNNWTAGVKRTGVKRTWNSTKKVKRKPMNLHEGQLKYSNRKKLSIIKVNREIALWICEMAKSWMPTTISKMMSMMIIIVLLYIYIHEMLPDCCTSSHGQEESTENRDKTNESNKSKLSKTIIFIQCIRITTRQY